MVLAFYDWLERVARRQEGRETVPVELSASYPAAATPWLMRATSGANQAAGGELAAAAGRRHYVLGYLCLLKGAAAGNDVAFQLQDGAAERVYDGFGCDAPRGSRIGIAAAVPIFEGAVNTAVNLSVGAAGDLAVTESTVWGYTL